MRGGGLSLPVTGSGPSSATFCMCDLGRIFELPRALVSMPRNGDSNSALYQGCRAAQVRSTRVAT